ncbi:FAD-dependent oxidoreductase [Aspergillus vadensis CBS 113365]|uniref:Salicylate hydroxylase n=1 Tax=Aspergillus vadensis (strain CBS 113365 / IMI 142717 / IBT 24658) TaxID=1448311 RepID=A0A319BCM0_ASPVC|nr:salicylate hydroxylase [Aspergillus vadensis CBS 113365]PYH68440.1 salicylate hydroxylase [Aspergillus vadensis CBS 113365]
MSTWRPGKRVAIAGGGPGAISTALAFIKRGYDVRVFERQTECRAIGGAVLLSIPVLAILRSYGISLENFGSYTSTYFKNKWGKERALLPFNEEVERRMGIKGWQYGVLRSSAFQKMLDLVPDGVIFCSHEVTGYEEVEGEVEVKFKDSNITPIKADILIAGDGIRSAVSRQAFGDPHLFHTGIRLWLAWCDHIPGIPANTGVISHDWQNQASFFPMLHDGKPGFEWWVVEPGWEGKPLPEDRKTYVENILQGWSDPMRQLVEATDFDTQTWSTGRIVGVGDAVHPVSPYAAYGMGMAVEDGYYLAKALEGVDLRDSRAVSAGFELFERQRVDYVNHHMEFARFLSYVFHNLPWPLAKLRDLVFDYTPFLRILLQKEYLKRSEDETMDLKELHVV